MQGSGTFCRSLANSEQEQRDILFLPLLTHNSSTRGDNYPDTGGLDKSVHFWWIWSLLRNVVHVGLIFKVRVRRDDFAIVGS